jgi:hypothetical protein
LVKRRDALDEILRYAPGALNNLFLSGNDKQGTLDTRDNLGELGNQLQENPAAVLCTFVNGPGCAQIKQALIPAGAPRSAPFTGEVKAKPRVTEPIDRSLGGLVEVSR